jgi:hypothetical protein
MLCSPLKVIHHSGGTHFTGLDGLLSHCKDWGNMSPQNVGWLSAGNTVLYTRRQDSLQPLWELKILHIICLLWARQWWIMLYYAEMQYIISGLVNCWWPIPEHSFLVPSPTGIMVMFCCLMAGSHVTHSAIYCIILNDILHYTHIFHPCVKSLLREIWSNP